MTCDLDGIVLSNLNPPMTHPGPTTFGDDRHLNTWEEYGDIQANKQTNVYFELENYELFKLFSIYVVLHFHEDPNL